MRCVCPVSYVTKKACHQSAMWNGRLLEKILTPRELNLRNVSRNFVLGSKVWDCKYTIYILYVSLKTKAYCRISHSDLEACTWSFPGRRPWRIQQFFDSIEQVITGYFVDWVLWGMEPEPGISNPILDVLRDYIYWATDTWLGWRA